jgi:hypothetical protein
MMQQMLIAGGLRTPTAVYVDGATGADSATLPAHAIGDLILAFAFRDDADVAPSTGAGFTSLDILQIAGSRAARIAYRIATVTNTASGTWTNAMNVAFVIYRNAEAGNFASDSSAAAASVTYAELAPTAPDGSSLLVGFAGHGSGDTSLQTPPTGMTNRQTLAHASDEVAAHESTEGRFLWPATAVAVGGTAGKWISYVVEVKSV